MRHTLWEIFPVHLTRPRTVRKTRWPRELRTMMDPGPSCCEAILQTAQSLCPQSAFLTHKPTDEQLLWFFYNQISSDTVEFSFSTEETPTVHPWISRKTKLRNIAKQKKWTTHLSYILNLIKVVLLAPYQILALSCGRSSTALLKDSKLFLFFNFQSFSTLFLPVFVFVL